MASINRFQDLNCWKQSRILENKIWDISSIGSFSKDYGLKDQINRATGSTMDNIAEGFGRGGNKEFINFLIISRGSILEVQSQLHRALDRKHITQIVFDECFEITESITKLLTSFILYLRNSPEKGPRYS
jgi:four helix bundle protein